MVTTVSEAEITENDMPRRVALTLGYALVSVAWYAIIRFAVVGPISLLWVLFPGPAAAGAWLLVVEPFAVAVATVLTLQTNIRNLKLHRVMAVMVVVSTILPMAQIHLATPNVDVAHASDGARIAAYFVQVLAVLVATWVALRVVKGRRAKLANEGTTQTGFSTGG
jgi:hypothetical protein